MLLIRHAKLSSKSIIQIKYLPKSTYLALNDELNDEFIGINWMKDLFYTQHLNLKSTLIAHTVLLSVITWIISFLKSWGTFHDLISYSLYYPG